jgi:hypothetical protein
MSRVVGWIIVLLVIGAVAACGGSSNQSGAPGQAPAAALCHQLPSGCAPGSAGGPTQATPATPTGTGTSVSAPSAGASPSPAAVKSCLQQAGFSILERPSLPNEAAFWGVSNNSSTFQAVVDFKIEAELQSYIATPGVGHYDQRGTYLVGPIKTAAERDLASQIVRCIR